jgi:hypothetical protein
VLLQVYHLNVKFFPKEDPKDRGQELVRFYILFMKLIIFFEEMLVTICIKYVKGFYSVDVLQFIFQEQSIGL